MAIVPTVPKPAPVPKPVEVPSAPHPEPVEPPQPVEPEPVEPPKPVEPPEPKEPPKPEEPKPDTPKSGGSDEGEDKPTKSEDGPGPDGGDSSSSKPDNDDPPDADSDSDSNSDSPDGTDSDPPQSSSTETPELPDPGDAAPSPSASAPVAAPTGSPVFASAPSSSTITPTPSPSAVTAGPQPIPTWAIPLIVIASLMGLVFLIALPIFCARERRRKDERGVGGSKKANYTRPVGKALAAATGAFIPIWLAKRSGRKNERERRERLGEDKALYANAERESWRSEEYAGAGAGPAPMTERALQRGGSVVSSLSAASGRGRGYERVPSPMGDERAHP
ncbi:hypothetical protein F5Y04DRAFT_78140 [Hypomontagnella monticulosa]|nr:hypothetical protein F5Y04DRAFT_78140 [Hypomontagnella monticulosa]